MAGMTQRVSRAARWSSLERAFRQEKGQNEISAIQEVSEQFDMPVISIITLQNIIDYLVSHNSGHVATIIEYQRLYGTPI